MALEPKERDFINVRRSENHASLFWFTEEIWFGERMWYAIDSFNLLCQLQSLVVKYACILGPPLQHDDCALLLRCAGSRSGMGGIEPNHRRLIYIASQLSSFDFDSLCFLLLRSNGWSEPRFSSSSWTCLIVIASARSFVRQCLMTRSTKSQKASDNVSEICVMSTKIQKSSEWKTDFATHSPETRTFQQSFRCRFSETRSKSNRRSAKSWRKARRRRWHDELTMKQCLACRHINWNLACFRLISRTIALLRWSAARSSVSRAFLFYVASRLTSLFNNCRASESVLFDKRGARRHCSLDTSPHPCLSKLLIINSVVK